jgi:hypothetical protein
MTEEQQLATAVGRFRPRSLCPAIHTQPLEQLLSRPLSSQPCSSLGGPGFDVSACSCIYPCGAARPSFCNTFFALSIPSLPSPSLPVDRVYQHHVSMLYLHVERQGSSKRIEEQFYDPPRHCPQHGTFRCSVCSYKKCRKYVFSLTASSKQFTNALPAGTCDRAHLHLSNQNSSIISLNPCYCHAHPPRHRGDNASISSSL